MWRPLFKFFILFTIAAVGEAQLLQSPDTNRSLLSRRTKEDSGFACQDSFCVGCDAQWKAGWCDTNCEKGQGKCMSKSGSSGTNSCAPLSQTGDKSKDSGKGMDDGKTMSKDSGKDSATKNSGKGTEAMACLSSTTTRAASGTSSFSSTYNISKASSGAFSGVGAILGFVPNGAGPFPLFLWMPGTGMCPGFPIPQIMAQEMANRGFVAVAVQYPDYTSYEKFADKASAVAGDNADTALSIMCAHEKVDCSAGVAIAGFSQGTHVAVLAAKHSSRIQAAYLIAGGRPTAGDITICDDVNVGSKISKTKRRYIVGDSDQYFSWLTDGSRGVCKSPENTTSNLKVASGYDCSGTNCIQADGSGFYVMTANDTKGAAPDHTSWFEMDKAGSSGSLATWFKPLNDAGLDWLAQAANATSGTAAAGTTAGDTTAGTTAQAATVSYSGNIRMNITGANKQQVEAATKAALAEKLSVSKDSITNVVAAESRRLAASERRLAGMWVVTYTVTQTAAQASTLQSKIDEVKNNASALETTMVTKLKAAGAANPTVKVTEITAARNTGSTTGSTTGITASGTCSYCMNLLALGVWAATALAALQQ